MKVPERIPLSSQIANLLEQHIREEGWTGTLPGYRKLCELLEVSPRTVHEALDLLERRQVIMPSSQGRPRQIRASSGAWVPNARQRKSLLILSDMPMQMQDIATRRVVEKIDQKFGKKGWDIDCIAHEEYASGRPGKGMEQLYSRHRHHRWLLVMPSLAMTQWCSARGLRIICLGGQMPDHGPPGIAVSRSQMLSSGIRELHSSGHTRISALVHLDTGTARDLTLQTLAKTFSEAGIPFHENYNLVQLPDKSPEALWESLEKLFRHSPPTALLATESHQVASIYSYCLENKLRIPQDVSLVVTQEGKHLEWFRPPLAHYQFPVDRFVKKLSRWIEHYPTRASKMHLLEARLERGGTISGG